MVPFASSLCDSDGAYNGHDCKPLFSTLTFTFRTHDGGDIVALVSRDDRRYHCGALQVLVPIGGAIGMYAGVIGYGFRAADSAETTAGGIRALAQTAVLGIVAGAAIGYTAPVSVPLLAPNRVFGEVGGNSNRNA